MMELDDVSVAIGARTIASGVSLTAEAGRVTAILGPNGSGKTTLLKAMSGDLKYSGSIRVNGREVRAMTPAEQAGHRAVLPQASNLSFPFTVREIVRLGIVAGRSGLSPKEAERLPDMALAKVDLAGFAGRFYQELSGGEQQRVQLARVLCQIWTPVLDGQPRALFLDEPVSSLDIRHQLSILQLAREFAAQGGCVVAILHDLNLAAMFADHLVLLRGGRIRASGSAAEVINDEQIADVYGCRLQVGARPAGDTPFVLPHSWVG